VASCIANNMLNEIAGQCPNGDTDAVGYARWYHAWDTPLSLLEQVRRLLAVGGCWSRSSRTITSSASAPGLAGRPLVDLRYQYDGRDVVLRAAGLAPFLVYETATLCQLDR
jgi:hypothetical protein